MDFYSYRQGCILGPLPPRMPDRADAQVPHNPAVGKLLYGRIGHFYFYEAATENCPAFGMIEIEISVQFVGRNRVLIEAYSVGDGYQSCSGSGRDAPLTIELHGRTGIIASAEWNYGDILSGHADPLTLSVETSLSQAEFDAIERVVLTAAERIREV